MMLLLVITGSGNGGLELLRRKRALHATWRRCTPGSLPATVDSASVPAIDHGTVAIHQERGSSEAVASRNSPSVIDVG